MNELQKRFAKKQLSPQQKRLIVEATQQPVRKLKLVSIVGPSFLLILTALILLTLNGQNGSETTAATSDLILSTNYFLNMCNTVLIVGICLYILKLMKDGQWRLPIRWGGVIRRTAILWIVGLITGYLTVDAIVGMHSYYKEIMFMLLLLLLLTLYICCPLDVTSGRGMLFKRWLFIVSFIVLFISLMINWTIEPLDKINATAEVLSFPTRVDWESYRLGQIGVWLFVFGTVGLISSMKKYRALTLVLLFFTLNAVPGSITFVKQTFFAEDAAAIHYVNDGRCQYQDDMQGVVDFRCELTLKNRSNEPATFTLELFQPREKEYATIEVFNEVGPFTYTLQPKERRTIVIENKIKMGHLPAEKRLYAGDAAVNVKIFDEHTDNYQ